MCGNCLLFFERRSLKLFLFDAFFCSPKVCSLTLSYVFLMFDHQLLYKSHGKIYLVHSLCNALQIHKVSGIVLIWFDG